MLQDYSFPSLLRVMIAVIIVIPLSSLQLPTQTHTTGKQNETRLYRPNQDQPDPRPSAHPQHPQLNCWLWRLSLFLTFHHDLYFCGGGETVHGRGFASPRIWEFWIVRGEWVSETRRERGNALVTYHKSCSRLLSFPPFSSLRQLTVFKMISGDGWNDMLYSAMAKGGQSYAVSHVPFPSSVLLCKPTPIND